MKSQHIEISIPVICLNAIVYLEATSRPAFDGVWYKNKTITITDVKPYTRPTSKTTHRNKMTSEIFVPWSKFLDTNYLDTKL